MRRADPAPVPVPERARRRRGNLLLLVLSTLFAAGLGEVFVRLVAPRDLVGVITVSTASGLRVNRSSGSAGHQLGKRRVSYRFFPPHLRDTPPDAAAHRILVLGDSFTFGVLLPWEQTFVHRLQQRIDEEFGQRVFQLLNAATGGWGTADYVAFVEECGDEIDPEMVVVFLNTDDIGRSIDSPLYEVVDSSAYRLERRRVERRALKQIANAIPGYAWLVDHSHLLQLLRAAFLLVLQPEQAGARGSFDPMAVPSSDGLTVPAGPAVRLGQTLFQRLIDWCEVRGIPLLVLTTGWHAPPYGEGEAEPTRAFMRKAERFFHTHGVAYADLSPRIYPVRREDPGRYVIAGDGHPNEAGSALIAHHAWPYLRARLRMLQQPSLP